MEKIWISDILLTRKKKKALKIKAWEIYGFLLWVRKARMLLWFRKDEILLWFRKKLKYFYDLEKLFHFINSIYYNPMRKIEGRIREYMENGVKEEEEGIPSIHQIISNYVIWKLFFLHMGHDDIIIEFNCKEKFIWWRKSSWEKLHIILWIED